MTIQEFRGLLQAGHGRAMVYAQEHDVSRFRDVILDACLECYSMDQQVEGTRAGYMLEFVQLTSEPEFYGDRVLESLREGGDSWSTTQRFRFATAMALEGDERARRAVFANFDPGPRQGDWVAVDLLELEGPQGLQVAAAKMGALLRRRGDEVDQGWLWSAAVSEFGEEEALSVLREAAATDADVQLYLAAVEAPRDREVRANFRDRRWAIKASPEEWESAARELLRAETAEDQLRFLSPFRFRAFPFEPDRLFDLTASSDERLAYAACKAISLVRHPAVREFALKLADSEREDRHWAVAMLGGNFEPGDQERVLRWYAAERDAVIRHWMGMKLLPFWESHPAPDSEILMLQLLYETAQCSHCREQAVRRLIQREALSPAMRRECAYDANEEIRKLVLPLL